MNFDLELDTAPAQEEFPLPLYSDPGSVLFRFYRDEHGQGFEVYDSDDSGAVFWIKEGLGLDYWLDSWFDLDHDGWFVVEVTGGFAWTNWSSPNGPESDEEFYIGNVRYATEEEIREQTLYVVEEWDFQGMSENF